MRVRDVSVALRRGLTFWRRSIQARIVVSTVLLSATVVGIVGWYLLQSTTDGLVDDRVKAVVSEASNETADAEERLGKVPGTDFSVDQQLNNLIETCHDGAKGFETAAEEVHDSSARDLFRQYAHERSRFAEELRVEVQRLGGSPGDDGSVAGAAESS